MKWIEGPAFSWLDCRIAKGMFRWNFFSIVATTMMEMMLMLVIEGGFY